MKKLLLPLLLITLIAAGCNTNNAKQTEEPNTTQNTELKTYINNRYHYQFEYPTTASVSEFPKESFSSKVGDTPEAAYQRLGSEVCITLKYENGYIAISAPENNTDPNAVCLRSGVGVGAEFLTEKLTIQGKEITGDKIFETYSESTRYILDDNTQIEIGGGGKNQEDYQAYLKIKPELLRVIQSYKTIK